MWIPPPPPPPPKKKVKSLLCEKGNSLKGICGGNKVTAICRVGSGVVLHTNNNNNVVEIFRLHDSPWLYSTTSTSVIAQSTHAKSISNQQPGREWECCVLSSRDTRLTSWVSKPICGDSVAVSLGWGDVKDNGKHKHKNQALLYKSQLGHTKLLPEGLQQESVRKPSFNNFLNPNMGL